MAVDVIAKPRTSGGGEIEVVSISERIDRAFAEIRRMREQLERNAEVIDRIKRGR